MRRETRKRRRRRMAAWWKHEVSKRKLQKAASNVERHQTQFYCALKYQEAVVAEYNVTGRALSKFDR